MSLTAGGVGALVERLISPGGAVPAGWDAGRLIVVDLPLVGVASWMPKSVQSVERPEQGRVDQRHGPEEGAELESP